MSESPETGPIGATPTASLLAALASKSPAPGGGAAAGVVGATAAALAGMVVAYSVDRKSLATHRAFLGDAASRLERARSVFLLLADEDAAAYGALNRMMKLPEDHPDRVSGWSTAVENAITPPRAMLAASNDVLRLCEDLVGKTNPHLNSDLAVAAVQAEAAARSAAWNIRVNAPSLPEERRRGLIAETEHTIRQARARAERIESACG